jgi:hypothetical protein
MSSKTHTEEFISQYEKIGHEVENMLNDLTEEQINWKPSQKEWSVGECIQHLNITLKEYLPNLEAAVNDADQMEFAMKDPLKYSLMGRFLRKMDPPVKLKLKSPKMFKPEKSNLNVSELLKDYKVLHEQLLNFIKKSELIDLNKTKFPSPVTSLIKVRAGEYFEFTAAHERRHLWQAKKVMEREGFPPGRN